jgi:hypothetical protein
MLRFPDSATYNFVLLFQPDLAADAPNAQTLGAILTGAGFRDELGGNVSLNVQSFARGEPFENPLVLLINEGEGCLECKFVDGLADQTIEVQLGAARFLQESLFSDPHYTLELRDRLVASLEALTTLPGFRLGFSLHLGDDEEELTYRAWFAECVVKGRFSLPRLVHHTYLTRLALFIGPEYVQRYGRDLFLNCPAWRVSEPRDDVLCVFFDNVIPASRKLHRLHDVSYLREALAYLRERLPPE